MCVYWILFPVVPCEKSVIFRVVEAVGKSVWPTFILFFQVVQSTRALQWIMENMKSQGVTPKEAQSICQESSSAHSVIASHLQLYYMLNLLFVFTPTSLQHQLQQMRWLTLWEIFQRSRSASTWTLVSFAIPTATSYASPCLRRKSRGRYFTWKKKSLTACQDGLWLFDLMFSSCSGELQLIHAGWQWRPCRWVCSDWERTISNVLFLCGLACGNVSS